jgi:hypothetical protein
MSELKNQTLQQLQELTSAIRDMASRVNAEFVQDDRKTQNYIAAAEERERERKRA